MDTGGISQIIICIDFLLGWLCFKMGITYIWSLRYMGIWCAVLQYLATYSEWLHFTTTLCSARLATW